MCDWVPAPDQCPVQHMDLLEEGVRGGKKGMSLS